MERNLPTGTVTFLFTDIEGSTRLLHSLGPERYAAALAEHRRLLREAFSSYGGVEVDTQGDAFFVAFPTAPHAVTAARESQEALAAGPIRVRMGLHTGTPTLAAEGYVGVDVHRGARVAALAHGGQVLVSEATSALLAPEESLTDLGRHRLKDFDTAVRLLQLGTATFPPLRTPGTVMLPTPATAFLGRERELHEAVSVVLDDDPAIFTILGPGGTGKTRFAIELARLIADDADGGTLFVPLAPLQDPALVLPAIAEALGADGVDAASIAARVGDKRTHLVLDNLEQLLPASAAPLATLAGATPSLRFFLTSREALHVGAETRFDLPPLALDEAVAFFVARARAVQARIEPSSTVSTLCEQLDQLPLALELAAARTRLLTPEAVLERLSTRLDLPAQRDADPRHVTLRATIAWSYDLLSPAEQELFAGLAVFRGGCTLEALERVCDSDLDMLASLIDKSLVRRRIDAGVDRYWILDTIHEYAAERLDDSGRSNSLRRRHAEHMLELTRSARFSPETGLGTGAQRHDLVLAERQNVRAALDWTLRHDVDLGLEIALALENFWVAHAPAAGARRLEELLDRRGELPPELVPRVRRMQGNHARFAGDDTLALRLYAESIAAYRGLGDDVGAATVMVRRVACLIAAGEMVEAGEQLRASLTIVQEHELTWVEAQIVGLFAAIDRAEGRTTQALANSRRSAELAEQCGFRWWQGQQLCEVLELCIELGNLEDAAEAGRKALHLAAYMEDRRLMSWTMAGLARVALARGEAARAGRLWGAVVDAGDSVALDTEALRDFCGPLEAVTDPLFLAAVDDGRGNGLDATARAVLVDLAEAQIDP